MNATPVSAMVALGLLMVKLKVVVPPTPMAAAPNALAMVGVGIARFLGGRVASIPDISRIRCQMIADDRR
jgi:hypothetical protein